MPFTDDIQLYLDAQSAFFNFYPTLSANLNWFIQSINHIELIKVA